jgi:hypothetical protein
MVTFFYWINWANVPQRAAVAFMEIAKQVPQQAAFG